MLMPVCQSICKLVDPLTLVQPDLFIRQENGLLWIIPVFRGLSYSLGPREYRDAHTAEWPDLIF